MTANADTSVTPPASRFSLSRLLPTAALAKPLAALRTFFTPVARVMSNPALPVSLGAGYLTALALAILTVILLGDPFEEEGAGHGPDVVVALADTPESHGEPRVLDGHAPAAETHETHDAHPAPEAHDAHETPPAPAEQERAAAPRGPVAELMEKGPFGPLPRIGASGLTPMKAYARPFPLDDHRPRVAIVVTGLGLSLAMTKDAIERLPGEITLAFSAYASGAQEWADLARYEGHEILGELPMQPFDFPDNDPGPYALLTDMSPSENDTRLQWLLSRVTAYPGVITGGGEDFLGQRAALTPVLEAVRGRGLFLLDASASLRSEVPRLGPSLGIPYASGANVIDARPEKAAIDDALAALEARARETGRAIGIATPYPVTLDRLIAWTGELEARGIALAPISAMVENPAPAGLLAPGAPLSETHEPHETPDPHGPAEPPVDAVSPVRGHDGH